MKPESEEEVAQYTLPTLNELIGAVPEGNSVETSEAFAESDTKYGGLGLVVHAIAVLGS